MRAATATQCTRAVATHCHRTTKAGMCFSNNEYHRPGLTSVQHRENCGHGCGSCGCGGCGCPCGVGHGSPVWPRVRAVARVTAPPRTRGTHTRQGPPTADSRPALAAAVDHACTGTRLAGAPPPTHCRQGHAAQSARHTHSSDNVAAAIIGAAAAVCGAARPRLLSMVRDHLASIFPP